jgi:Mg2+ and Co2+ transporter CorA
MQTSDILKDSSIYARDLVSLQLTTKQEYQNPQRGIGASRRTLCAILPRGNEILLSFGAIRAVVGTKHAWIFDAQSIVVKEFSKDVSRLLKRKSKRTNDPLKNAVDTTGANSKASLHIEESETLLEEEEIIEYGDLYERSLHDRSNEAFELVFLEAVLRETTEVFQRRIRLYDPIVDSFLDKVANEVFSDSGVHLLVPLKDALQGFEMHVRQCVECLTDLLNNDDDLLSLLLTEQEVAFEQGLQVDYSRHTNVELLLEEYARQLNNCLFEIHYLLQRLQSKQEFVQLALSSYRNRMIRMNLYVTITGLSLALSTTIAGFFGMNLINGFESNPEAFQVVVTSTLVAGVVASASCFSYISGSTMQKRAKQRLEEIQTLNNALSDMNALDVTIKQLLNGKTGMTREKFRERLAASRVSGTVTREEADLLFNSMDQHKDGILLHEDFESLLHLQKHNIGRHT